MLVLEVSGDVVLADLRSALPLTDSTYIARVTYCQIFKCDQKLMKFSDRSFHVPTDKLCLMLHSSFITCLPLNTGLLFVSVARWILPSVALDAWGEPHQAKPNATVVAWYITCDLCLENVVVHYRLAVRPT